MKRKINLYFMTVSGLVILATLLLSLFVSYDVIKAQVMEELKAYTVLLQDRAELYGAVADGLRITVVSGDGRVLYDNQANKSSMDNHSDREEIAKALKDGEGYTVRTSDTLSKSLFYYAARTDDGGVIRVSREASSVFGLFERFIPLVIGIVIVMFALCAVLSRFITAGLIAPIENMGKHMDNIESVEIYEELKPFVETINRQHRDILKNATMRQDFTANVTHELKTPLTSISGYAELMENGLADEKMTVKFAGAIHKNADRLLTLINDIIRLSELDAMQTAPEFEDIDLYQLVLSTAQFLELTANRQNITVRTEGSSQLIHGNRQMIEELVYNICDNAIRYNRAGGYVEIGVQRDRRGVVLIVRDNGIGIPKEHQERIFERFYRVDKSRSKERGGTGLGLAIVKHIAQVHGAQVSVQSEPGKGTQIMVIFMLNN